MNQFNSQEANAIRDKNWKFSQIACIILSSVSNILLLYIILLTEEIGRGIEVGKKHKGKRKGRKD